MRLFIDSDIFVRSLRYPRDKKGQVNQKFINLVRQKNVKGLTSIYNLLEICGILSFNLNKEALYALYAGFRDQYSLKILFPSQEEEVSFSPSEILSLMARKLSFNDALIVTIAEENRKVLDGFVTWNASHFKGKLNFKVFLPSEIVSLFGSSK